MSAPLPFDPRQLFIGGQWRAAAGGRTLPLENPSDRSLVGEIARSLVINPSFLLLDEPFSGIDPIQVLELQRIIFDLKRSGIGILVTDHNVRETLAVTERAYIINNGKIFRAGSPEALGRDPEVKRVYLGEGFQLESRSA